jgi:Zn-dependent peptidase ImmA (M78 family)/DNA-binding XRE family transcriptional regulator
MVNEIIGLRTYLSREKEHIMSNNLFLKIDPRILGSRLQTARKNANLTQQVVADQLGLARTTLGSIEQGERLPKEEELFHLSQLYHQSINDLLRQQAPLEPLTVQFRAARRFEAKLDKEIDKKIREFQDLCSDYLYLEQLLGNTLPPTQVPIYHIDAAAPERIAEDAAIAERNRLGLGDAPILNLRELLDAEGLRIFQMKLPAKVSGFFGYNDQLGPCIAINSDHRAERRQWSLAHEYAHFLTDRHQADISVHNAYQHVPEHERFADAFASIFLLPASSVSRRFHEMKRVRKNFLPADLCILAHYFFVSFEAMTNRLEKLHLIKPGTFEYIHNKGFRPQEAFSLLNLEPHPFSQDMFPLRYKYLATEAFYKEEISEDEYAHFLRTDLVYARHTFQKLSTQAIITASGEDTTIEVSLDDTIGA